MATQILMPALSPTMTEGKLARWLKNVGDDVRAGDVIAEIETDKATMEVEAVDEGKLARILIEEGTEGVAVNTPIAELSNGADTAAPAAGSATRPPPAVSPVPAPAPASVVEPPPVYTEPLAPAPVAGPAEPIAPPPAETTPPPPSESTPAPPPPSESPTLGPPPGPPESEIPPPAPEPPPANVLEIPGLAPITLPGPPPAPPAPAPPA